MKTALLALALACFGQEKPSARIPYSKSEGILRNSIPTGYRYLWGSATGHVGITIDKPGQHQKISLILRNSKGQPIAFCNVVKERCWDLSPKIERDASPTIGATKMVIRAGSKESQEAVWWDFAPSRIGVGDPSPSKPLHISKEPQ